MSENVPTPPHLLLEAVGELAKAIAPHNNDRSQRQRIANALHVLVDHIVNQAALAAKGTGDE